MARLSQSLSAHLAKPAATAQAAAAPELPPDFAAHVAKAGDALRAAGVDDQHAKLFTAGARYLALLRLGIARKGLALIGPPGVGKTHLLRALSTIRKIGIIEAAALANDYQAAGSDPARAAILDHYANFGSDLIGTRTHLPVIIDDLGAESECVVYGRRTEVLADLILARARVHVDHPIALTHLSTNLTDQQIAHRYGPRIWSRIQGLCNLVIITRGPDRRAQTQDPL